MQAQEEIGRCIEGLTLYAIERDICMESGDTVARTGRIRGLIGGMSELYGLPGKLSEAFDERIGAARGCSCGPEHQIFIDAPGLSFANETSFQMEDAGPRMTL